MQVTRLKYCVDCIYCTVVFPDCQLPFYQCGNPDFCEVDQVDGAKYWPTCRDARSSVCGASARGYLAINPPSYEDWKRHTQDREIYWIPPRKPLYVRFVSWLMERRHER